MSVGQKIIHWRIAKTAKAIAAAAYEEMASIDAFYHANKSMKRYVDKNWKDYIPFARQSLLQILAKDFKHDIALGSYTPEGVEKMKEEVYECLILDGSFKAPAEQGSGLVLH